jgi:drug/metabolite transporter (DMT)-like permease
MFSDHLLDNVPVWAFFILIALLALVPIEVGQRLGVRRRRMTDHEHEGPVGNAVGATLALLGFMVALTVGAAVARFDARKEALIDGVNAIETAFRNASLLPEPHNSASRKLLREYVGMRLEMPRVFGDPDRLRAMETRIRSLQQSLWSHAETLAKEDRSSEIYALFASSLNEVFQVHNKRVILGSQHRIPLLVWVVLMIVTVISTLGVGFQFGLAGNRSPIANLLLGLTFALVMTLIFDLEQPGKGLIDVSQQPMYDLDERLRAEE